MSGGEAALAPLRAEIDAIDAAMVDLLAQRYRVVQRVAAIKLRETIAARLEGRVEEVIRNVRGKAAGADCPPDLAEAVWRPMIAWIIEFEERVLLAEGDRHD